MPELKKILVVDDSSDTRELACMSLENAKKFEVKSTASGAACVELCTSWAPDLVLLDVVIPRENGLDTMKRIQALDSKISVIFLTARVENEEVETYLALGAIGVISKPFDVLRLPDYVENVWRGQW